MKITLRPNTLASILAVTGAILAASDADAQSARPKPLMRDFIGLNTHTVQFRPDLYRPVTELVRDYHNMDWDVAKETSNPTQFPMSRNGVNWQDLYGAWKKAGYRIDVSSMFETFPVEDWKDLPKDAFAYGESFARYFGPSGQKLVESVEVGNEPVKFSDVDYRRVFENMARGIRSGDPKMLISTCAVKNGTGDKYSRDINVLKGLEPLYDVINIHSYAFQELWPTWRRSFPEDPKIVFLKEIQEMVDWRDKNAKGKRLWITEFGWDATTKPAPATGDFSKWVGSTDTEQARYLVRSFLTFSAMDIDRAYIYWFNDDDTPHLHASSGLTRNYIPKPSYHAVSHLYRTLGDYRFARAVVKEEGVYAYEYQRAGNAKDCIWAVWSPTGTNRSADVVLPAPKGKIVRAEQMPLSAAAPTTVAATTANGHLRLRIDESPTYIWIK